ncbi:MAG: flavodoxin family protein [Treponema sp.]|nr:flavodoxin family protein [Treponema sp.]
MDILILNGSPRTSGTVARLLHEIESSALKNGATVTFTDVSRLSFASCTGCMACRKTGKCVLPHDDAHVIAEKIKSCSAIATGTPVYWGNMNGELKRLFDRLVYVLMKESPLGIPSPLNKGKAAIIVSACTTPFPFNILCGQTTKAFAALKEILCTSGFKIKGSVTAAGKVKSEKMILRKTRKAQALGKKISK